MLPGRTIITTDASLLEIKRMVRDETIDKFVEHIENEISENTIWGMLPIDCKDSIADEIVEYVIDISKKIAEQMKEEGE